MENDKKENSPDAKSGDASSELEKKANSTKNSEAKDKLNAIVKKAGELANKALVLGKAVMKDVAKELKQVNAIRKETVATATEGTKKKELVKVFWTKISGKQKAILVGMAAVFLYISYSALFTSSNQGMSPVAQPNSSQPRSAKDISFTATLFCGMGPNDHINIGACFAGGSSNADTELELRNGNQYGLYKAYNLSNIGTETREGFQIKLGQHFELKAQNADKNLTLGLVITGDQTGKIYYQKQVAQYGVIRISN